MVQGDAAAVSAGPLSGMAASCPQSEPPFARNNARGRFPQLEEISCASPFSSLEVQMDIRDLASLHLRPATRSLVPVRKQAIGLESTGNRNVRKEPKASSGGY